MNAPRTEPTPPRSIDLIRFEGALRRFVGQRTRDTHLRDDIVQETFLYALARLSDLRDPKCLGAWLFRIAERRLIDALRAHGDAVPLTTDPPAPTRRHNDSDVRGMIELLRCLPPSLRRPMRMHYIQGRSLREVARRLDTSESGVKSRLYRARRILRGERK